MKLPPRINDPKSPAEVIAIVLPAMSAPTAAPLSAPALRLLVVIPAMSVVGTTRLPPLAVKAGLVASAHEVESSRKYRMVPVSRPPSTSQSSTLRPTSLPLATAISTSDDLVTMVVLEQPVVVATSAATQTNLTSEDIGI